MCTQSCALTRIEHAALARRTNRGRCDTANTLQIGPHHRA
jgi:hypothetical protein